MDANLGYIVVAVFSLVINLITIIKFTNALEKRLTTLEVTIKQGISPNIARMDKTLLNLINRKRVEQKDE